MNTYFGDKFFPKNFILLGSNVDELECKAGDIVAEANKLFPKSFCGDRSAFPFEFRYVPPFEKSYGELKRLQGTIANYAGRRSEYCGYILIDMNSYIKHESENYFDVTIKFLADNNDCWNYIFIVDNTHLKASMSMVQKILMYIHCKVIVDNEKGTNAEKRFIKKIVDDCGIECTHTVIDFLVDAILQKKMSREVAKTIILDIAAERSEAIPVDMDTLAEYLSEETPTAKYMLSDAQFEEIIMMCIKENRKGKHDDEKI